MEALPSKDTRVHVKVRERRVHRLRFENRLLNSRRVTGPLATEVDNVGM